MKKLYLYIRLSDADDDLKFKTESESMPAILFPVQRWIFQHTRMRRLTYVPVLWPGAEYAGDWPEAGVDKSTVSRTIKRGEWRLQRRLLYVAKGLLES